MFRCRLIIVFCLSPNKGLFGLLEIKEYNNRLTAINFSFGLVVYFACLSSFFSWTKNRLSTRIIMLSVCIPTIPNIFLFVIIRKYKSYINIIINNFFL
jgi:hypothetical protein